VKYCDLNWHVPQHLLIFQPTYRWVGTAAGQPIIFVAYFTYFSDFLNNLIVSHSLIPHYFTYLSDFLLIWCVLWTKWSCFDDKYCRLQRNHLLLLYQLKSRSVQINWYIFLDFICLRMVLCPLSDFLVNLDVFASGV